VTGPESPHESQAPGELGYGEILDRVAELTTGLLDGVDGRGADPEVAARVEELVDWLDVFHREGLGRLVDMVRQWRGELFLEQAALDPVVGELLATYGLGVAVDAATADRVVQLALDEVRPYVHSHGGEIEVTSVLDGVVNLRLHGSCDGCTAADDTISHRIEVALREHWIDFRRIEVAEPRAAPHPPPAPGQVVTGLGIGRRPE
jgi:Fe-S cluster biogenesis protein NfuA